MTGAMYSAIAGLKSHMEKLSVIGNNIANVNTYGYKASRATFQESLYTSVAPGSSGTQTLGGTNPSQIGYGCKVGTIDLDMSTKNYVATGKSMDVMINGDGFFMVGDKNHTPATAEDAKDLNLTRVGNFTFDASGYLVDGAGGVVYGFLTAAADNGSTEADYENGDGQTKGISTNLTAIRLPMAAQGDDDTPAGTAVYPYVTGNKTVDATDGVSDEGSRVSLEGITIDATGMISGINSATKENVVIGYIALATVGNPNGVTHTDGSYYRALGGAGDLTVSTIGGSVTGYLNNKKTGDVANMISGAGDTTLIPYGLESSGTDLATEFSEMITTQRGYQANTRIITVTDSMLEELVNMKR